MPDQFHKKIIDVSTVSFSIDQFGIYSIAITASCQSDQDLKIEIDDLKFREIPPENKLQYINIPPAWNGTNLKGLKKTVVFLIKLNKGNHSLTFVSNKGATVDEFKVAYISDPTNISFDAEVQADDGDRRPWYTFALIDLPLRSITADVTTKWHFLDGDDIKLIIDNQIKKNANSILHKNWVWAATIFNLFGKERQEKTFTENLKAGIHYIEFWADKTPTLHKVKLDLGEVTQKRIPTVDDPMWTGKFEDDTDQMILARAIFGEARSNNYPDNARIAVGLSIRNRVEDSRWPDRYQRVITQKEQYSSFNEDDGNRPYVENPFWKNNEVDKTVWYNCYDISGKVIRGEIKDLTNGANHYYDDNISPPNWATKETLVLTIKSLDNKAALFFHKL